MVLKHMWSPSGIKFGMQKRQRRGSDPNKKNTKGSWRLELCLKGVLTKAKKHSNIKKKFSTLIPSFQSTTRSPKAKKTLGCCTESSSLGFGGAVSQCREELLKTHREVTGDLLQKQENPVKRHSKLPVKQLFLYVKDSKITTTHCWRTRSMKPQCMRKNRNKKSPEQIPKSQSSLT